jgi:hypothetical protein
MITIYENEEIIEEREEEIEVTNGRIENGIRQRKIDDDPNSKLSPYITEFVDEYTQELEKNRRLAEPNVVVSDVLGGLAKLYERIRTTIEYKGEHVLRRNAIERIIKRLVWEKESIRPDIDVKKISEALIRELIWAGYLPNNKLPQSKVLQTEQVVGKYLYLLNNMDNPPPGLSKSKIRSWIWGVASSEIEDLLDPSNRELYVKLMYNWFVNHFFWKDSKLDDHEKEIQIYLAIHRAYPKSDDAIMRYFLLMREFPYWQTADRQAVHRFILEFPRIHTEIEKHLNFPGRFILYRKMQKHAAAFDILREVIRSERSNIAKLLNDVGKLEDKVRQICELNYNGIKSKVRTGIVRSIIYIFITKVVFALSLEVPFEVYRYGDVKYLPLSLNIIFPPLLMFLISFSIKVPGAKNTEMIIDKIKSIVYKRRSKDKYEFSTKQSTARSSMLNIFGLLYVALILFVFGGISYLLIDIGYSLFGVIVFFVFMSLVLLFAFRVRFQANRLKVDSNKEGLFSHLTSYITLPLLNFGFYLSRGFAKINFFTIILDFLIEAPLKSIIEIFEEWTSFIREKKEEVVEIPE